MRYTSDHYMQVEYPDGTVSLYGNGPHTVVRKTGEPEKTFRWYLRRITDPNGNSILYTYMGGAVDGDGLFVEPYLAKIEYGHNNRYSVDLNWTWKEDYRIDGRSGLFPIKDVARLTSVAVSSNGGSDERVFELKYEDAALTGKVLSSIAEYSENMTLLNEHVFEYTEVGYDYDDDPQGVPVEYPAFKYFAEPGSQIFGSGLNRTTQVKEDLEDFKYTRSYLKSGPMDWNGDGALDFVFNVHGNYGLVRVMLSDGRSVPDTVNLETSFSLVDGTGTVVGCRYPFENQPNPNDNYPEHMNFFPPMFSQSMYVPYRDDDGVDWTGDNNAGFAYTNVGFYDMNGDGYRDVVHSCNYHLQVQFNKEGYLESESHGYPVEYQFPWNVESAYYNTYINSVPGVFNGTVEDNEFIERATLGKTNSSVYNRITYGGGESTWEEILQIHGIVEPIDMNGNGRMDRVFRKCNDSGCYYYLIQNIHDSNAGYSNGGFAELFEEIGQSSDLFGLSRQANVGYSHGLYSYSDNWSWTFELNGLIDFNGDGLPDLASAHWVRLNTGKLDETLRTNWKTASAEDTASFQEGAYRLTLSGSLEYSKLLDDPEGKYGPQPKKKVQIKRMEDMNGDGLVDIVKIHDSGVWVAVNTGSGFLDEQKWITLHDPDDELEVPFLSLSWTTETSATLEQGPFEGQKKTVTTTITEQFLRDCNGDGVPDFVVPGGTGDDFFRTRRCRLNRTGKLNRLRKISNEVTGRTIELGYTDGVKLDTASKTNSGRHRTVLSSVRSFNTFAYASPVQVWEYSYENGVEDRINRKFLGWEKLESRNYVERVKETEANWIDKKEFDFSSVEGMDYWGINELADEYNNGTLLKHETGYSVGRVYKTLSRVEYDYSELEVLDTTDKSKYVYPSKQYTSRFNNAGLCLYGEESPGVCNDREEKGTIVSIDPADGFIYHKEVTDSGDMHVEYDDVRTVVDYERIGDDSSAIIKKKLEETFQFGQKMSSVSYEYDPANGNLKWKREGDENDQTLISEFDYDPNGLLKETWVGGIPATAIEHQFDLPNAPGVAYRKISTTPDGSTTVSDYNYRNQLLKTTSNGGATEFFTYDDHGRLAGSGNHIAGEANVSYEYFSRDYVIYPDDDVRYFGTIAIADQAGEPMELVKITDASGRLVQEKKRARVDGDDMWIVAGNVQFDLMGRVEKLGQPRTAQMSVPADEYINMVLEDPVVYEYDDLGRVSLETDSEGLFKRYSRETVPGLVAAGHNINMTQTLYLERTTDHVGNRREVYSDIHGNALVDVRIAATGEHLVTQKNITSARAYEIIDPRGATSQVYRDSLGRMQSVITPDAGETEYVYSGQGKLDSIQRKGKEPGMVPVVTEYGYDQYGRIENVVNSDTGRNARIEYCPSSADSWSRNKVCTVLVGFSEHSDNIGSPRLSTRYEYGENWVTKSRTVVPWAGGGGTGNTGPSASMTYTMDAYGRTRSVTYPDGEEVVYAYDQAGRLKRVVGEAAYINEIRYNAHGQRTYVRNSNGFAREYEYYPVSRLLKNMRVYNALDENDVDFLDMTYTYDEQRRLLKSVTNPSDLQFEKFDLTYEFDKFDRILQMEANKPGDAWYVENTYHFDEGTRMILSDVTYGTAADERYRTTEFLGDSSAPESVTTVDGLGTVTELREYEYNNLGELLSATTFERDTATDSLLETDSKVFTFSNDGTLASAETPNNFVRFAYDLSGDRVLKQTTDKITNTVERNFYLFNLYSEKGELKNKHISDGKHVVATRLQGAKNRTFYMTPDHLGSTIMVTNKALSIVSKTLYDPFGNTMRETGDNPDANENERQFTNQIYDKETGLYYFNARYYDPKNGVFISPDPAMDGLNHYVYANGNPLLYTDPTGLAVNFDGDYQLSPLECAFMPLDFLGLGILPKAGTLVATKLALKAGTTMAKVALSKTGGYLLKGLSFGTRFVGRQIGNFASRFKNVVASSLPQTSGAAIEGTSRLAGKQVGRFRLTSTVAQHGDDIIRRGPFKGLPSRPYVNSPHTIEQIMKGGKGVPDPAGVPGALRWDVEGTFRGVEGIWELVVRGDEVLHFNFVR